MFESIMNFFKKLGKTENKETKSKEMAKERLHLVLMQDRANVSADFLELMKQEIIEVIKKYIEVDEKEIDVRLTNEVKTDGTTGAPSLYANIPIVNIKNEMKKEIQKDKNIEENKDKDNDSKQKEKTAEQNEKIKNNDEKQNENADQNTNDITEEKEEQKEKSKNKENNETIKSKEENKKENNVDNKSGE